MSFINSICERLHQTIASAMRATTCTNPPEHSLEAAHAVDTVLATAAHAARSLMHSTLGLSPGAIVFNRDMPLDIPVLTDLELLRQKRQVLIDKNCLRERKRRVEHHDYAIGDQVLKLEHKPHKTQERATGPCTATRVHANGSLTVRLNELMTDRLNMRRLKPFCAKANANAV